jgi:hypothetical protein
MLYVYPPEDPSEPENKTVAAAENKIERRREAACSGVCKPQQVRTCVPRMICLAR